MKTMAAGKFKAQCLGVLDQVEAKRETVVLTKHGRPVAQLVPMPLSDEDPIFGFYKGKIRIVGDIMAPLYTDEELAEFEKNSLRQLHP